MQKRKKKEAKKEEAGEIWRRSALEKNTSPINFISIFLLAVCTENAVLHGGDFMKKVLFLQGKKKTINIPNSFLHKKHTEHHPTLPVNKQNMRLAF